MAWRRAARLAVPPSKRRTAGSALTENRMRVRPAWGKSSSGSSASNLVVKRSCTGASQVPNRRIASAQRACQVFDAERVGVAGRLEGGALMGAVRRARGDRAPADIARQIVEDFRQV